MPGRDVHIKMQNGIPVAIPDPIKLGRDQGHTIEWHNLLDEEVTITFDKGTPFDHGHSYKVGAGKHKNSGGIKVQPTSTPWKYSITTASGIVNDPQVIIQPIVPPDPPTN